MHIDPDDVASFNILFYFPDQRYRRWINACLNIHVEPLGVSKLHGWISWYLLE